MDHKEFQRLAVRTESVVDTVEITQGNKDVFANTLQAYIALSEVLDVYKKHIFYGREIDRKALAEHLMAAMTYTQESIFALEDEVHSGGTELQPIDLDPRLFHALLGTITEHGELAIALSKGVNDLQLDLVNVCEELGDSDWYKALFYEATGIQWSEVQKMIIKKLEIRFKDKIFNEGEANERDLDAERKLLEESIKEAANEYEKTRNSIRS